MIYLIYIDIFIIYLLLSNILPMKLTSPAEAIVDTPPASSRVISGLTLLYPVFTVFTYSDYESQ